jgi:cobalt-zinc-cadmium efflux system membrane fusion protein
MKSPGLFLGTAALALVCAGCGREAAVVSAHKEAAPQEPGFVTIPVDSPKLARIHVATVENMEFASDEVTAPGRVEANPNRISKVVMPVGGRLRQVLVRLGDAVTEGQPLLIIDSPDAGAAMTAYRQAQAQARQARSLMGKSEKDLTRLRELYDHRAAALKEVQAAENDLAQAQAALEQAQAACDDAVHRLDLLGLKPGQAADVTVRSPIPGKVLDIAAVPGEYRSDTTAVLMTVADLSSVWISADVPESLIRKITLGEFIEVQLSAYPGETFRGRVARIADTVDPQTRTIKVQTEIANPGGRLRPEMFGQIRHTHGMASLPAIPYAAIVQRDGKNLALIEAGPGRFREQAINMGARQGDMVAVLSGIHAGERVVTDGTMLLRRD